MSVSTHISSQVVLKSSDLDTLETDQRELLTELAVAVKTLQHALEAYDVAAPLDEPLR